MELKRQKQGPKFLRQYRIDPFVIDFYCCEAGLAVEIDSAWHDGRWEEDSVRDDILLTRGVCILRVAADDVLDSPEGCAAWAANAASEVAAWRQAGSQPGHRSANAVRYPQ